MMFTQLWRMALTRTGEFNGRQEWLPRQNPLLLFTGGRSGKPTSPYPMLISSVPDVSMRILSGVVA
jgi:hypothetical protein